MKRLIPIHLEQDIVGRFQRKMHCVQSIDGSAPSSSLLLKIMQHHKFINEILRVNHVGGVVYMRPAYRHHLLMKPEPIKVEGLIFVKPIKVKCIRKPTHPRLGIECLVFFIASPRSVS